MIDAAASGEEPSPAPERRSLDCLLRAGPSMSHPLSSVAAAAIGLIKSLPVTVSASLNYLGGEAVVDDLASLEGITDRNCVCNV